MASLICIVAPLTSSCAFRAGAPTLSPGELRQGAELPKQSERVLLRPAFDDPAVLEPLDRHPADRGLAARRLEAHELAIVRPRRGPAGGDEIVLGDHLLDHERDVRERLTEATDELLRARGALEGLAHAAGAADEVGRKDLVRKVELSLAPDLVEHAASDLLVLIRHRHPPSSSPIKSRLRCTLWARDLPGAPVSFGSGFLDMAAPRRC